MDNTIEINITGAINFTPEPEPEPEPEQQFVLSIQARRSTTMSIPCFWGTYNECLTFLTGYAYNHPKRLEAVANPIKERGWTKFALPKSRGCWYWAAIHPKF